MNRLDPCLVEDRPVFATLVGDITATENGLGNLLGEAVEERQIVVCDVWRSIPPKLGAV